MVVSQLMTKTLRRTKNMTVESKSNVKESLIVPFMTQNEFNKVKEYVLKASFIVEWGSGGSTVDINNNPRKIGILQISSFELFLKIEINNKIHIKKIKIVPRDSNIFFIFN
jgi:hypothetical protein